MGKSSSSAPAPAPDPMVGQAAASNVELGKDWLQFSKDQFAAGNIRQDEYDKLVKQVVDSQLTSQAKADQWAQQDRDQGQAGKTQFDQLAAQAAANGIKYEGQLGAMADQFGGKANDQFDFAKAQQSRYNSTFSPIEDRLAKDAMTWDSAERLESEAGKAKADVAANAAQQQQASQRNMASMGVNPNSGRFAGVTAATGLNTALAQAGSQNLARDNVRAQGIQLRGQAVGVGQQVLNNANNATSMGLTAQQAKQNAITASNAAATSGMAQSGQLAATGLGAAGVGYQGLGTGITAGNAAVGNGGAANQNFYANNGTMTQGFSGAVGANSSAGSMLNSQYGTQVGAYNAQQQAAGQAAAGNGQAVGAVVGAGLMVF
jgi:hypothetical protein